MAMRSCSIGYTEEKIGDEARQQGISDEKIAILEKVIDKLISREYNTSPPNLRN